MDITQSVADAKRGKYFCVDDCEFMIEKDPKIEWHYTPMVVRGVMDADPEECEYEITPECIDVRIKFEVIA